MYHIEGRRQAEIAQHLRLSQATVSRMLKRAEAEDIVRTSVIPPVGTYSELEGALRQKFDLPEAIVVECSEDRDGAIMARIGEAAAHLLEITLSPGEIVGVSSWSQTIFQDGRKHPSAEKRPGKIRCPDPRRHGRPFGADTCNAAHHAACSPHRGRTQIASRAGRDDVEGSQAPDAVRSLVRETMDLFGSITLAIVGIGAVEPSELLARSGNIFSSRELADLAEAGAVGDISLRFFDKDGKPVKTPLDDRVIGLPLEDLARVDRVIALAGGAKKTAAISGALRVGVIDMLVTDKFTAQRLIDATA